MAQNQPHGKADDGLGGPRPHRSLSAQDIPADRGALPDPTFRPGQTRGFLRECDLQSVLCLRGTPGPCTGTVLPRLSAGCAPHSTGRGVLRRSVPNVDGL